MTLSAKCLPYSTTSTVGIDAVTALTITPAQRAVKPYPPGKVRVNGDYWPDGTTYAKADAVLTWAHRIRTAQADGAIVQQDAASTSGTIEGTYTVEVLVGGVSVRTVTGITATSWTYTQAMQTTDALTSTSSVQFRLTPVFGALSGTARTTDPFKLAQS